MSQIFICPRCGGHFYCTDAGMCQNCGIQFELAKGNKFPKKTGSRAMDDCIKRANNAHAYIRRTGERRRRRMAFKAAKQARTSNP